MAADTIRTMRIELKGNSVRVAVGDYTENAENGQFQEEYSRADHRLSEDRHERLSAVAWVINGCSALASGPIELVLVPEDGAAELIPLLRGDDPDEDLMLNFEMLGYKPKVKIEPDGFAAESTVRAPVPESDWYLYYSRLAAELMRLYHEKAGGFSFKLFTGDEYEFENRVSEQAMTICEALKEQPVCEAEVFCRMFKKIWLLKARVSRETYNRICLPADLLEGKEGDICEVSMASYDPQDLNGSIDFVRRERPEWLLTEEQKTVLREAFALMGKATPEDAGKSDLYLQNMATVHAGEKSMPLVGNSHFARMNSCFDIQRPMEVYACISDSYNAGTFKSGTIITELGIFASVGLRKKKQFFSWPHLLAEGIRQENNEYELWDKQSAVFTRRSKPVTGTINALCGELYVLLDSFLKLLEKDGYGQ